MNFPTFLNTICDSMCDENGNPITSDVANVKIKVVDLNGKSFDISGIKFWKEMNTIYISAEHPSEDTIMSWRR